MFIVVVDYGLGNLLSVARAVEAAGHSAKLSSNPQEIADASHVILPGVGAFEVCMRRLEDLKLTGVLIDVSQRKTPMLGICLGMQILFDYGLEFGRHPGLGLIPGVSRQLPTTSSTGARLKVPNIGWKPVHPAPHERAWCDSPLRGLNSGEHFYFLHSFAVEPAHEAHKLAGIEFGGHDVTVAVQVDRTFGLQFHPEKSGPAGLSVFKQFLTS